MKERPILFSAPMVLALLNGTKTQTRRLVKDQPPTHETKIPFCPSQHLWVKETHSLFVVTGKKTGVVYKAGGELKIEATHAGWSAMFAKAKGKWRPPIFMPRWASRIMLEIVGVRLEQLHNITDADAVAEGCSGANGALGEDYISVGPRTFQGMSWPRARYADLWDRLNGFGSWDKNPWVWAITFKRIA